MTASPASAIEWTLLNPLLTRAELDAACQDARRFGYHALTVAGAWVEEARAAADESGLKINCLVGFPYGAMESDVKRFETEAAADSGAHEIEAVINLARFRAGDHKFILRELRDIVEAADERPVKAVIEQSLWSDEQLRVLCQILLDSGAHFASTGTGFPGEPATPAEITRLREYLGPSFGIKAAGLATLDGASVLLRAGATRLGNKPPF